MRRNWIKVKKFSLGITQKNMSMEMQKIRRLKEREMGMLVGQISKEESERFKEVG